MGAAVAAREKNAVDVKYGNIFSVAVNADGLSRRDVAGLGDRYAVMHGRTFKGGNKMPGTLRRDAAANPIDPWLMLYLVANH